jgi:TRAP-type uncharacterized transport system substrate-binding protein
MKVTLNRRRAAALALAPVLVALVVGSAPAQQVSLPKQIILATDREGGGSHAMGAGLVSMLGKYSGTKAVVLPVGDPAKWVGMFKEAEIDFGMTSVTNLGWAYWGLHAYEGRPNKVFSLVALGAPITWGFMIPADAPANTPAELKTWLKGKRLSHNWINPIIDHLNLAGLANIGFPGGLAEAGITPVPVSSYQVFINLWIEGRVDVVGTPHVPLIQQMMAGRAGKFIAMNDDAESVARMQKSEPSYYILPQPNDAPGAKKGMPFLAYDYSLVARNSIETGVIRHVLETTLKHQEEWTAVHASIKGWFPADERWVSVNAPMPYHAEAIAFYKSKGWWSDKHEARQQVLLAKTK